MVVKRIARMKKTGLVSQPHATGRSNQSRPVVQAGQPTPAVRPSTHRPVRKSRAGAVASLISIAVVLLLAGVVALVMYSRDKHYKEMEEEARRRKARDEQAAEVKRLDEERIAENQRRDAEEAAKAAAKAKEEEEARRKAEIAERIEARQKLKTRFEEAEKAFSGKQVEIAGGVLQSRASGWCLVPGDEGKGRVFEIIPAFKDDPGKVMGIDEKCHEEIMFRSEFKERYLADAAGWLVLVDGKVLLYSRNPQKAGIPSEKMALPEDSQSSYDIAQLVYGNAAKAVKAYEMQPPAVSWDVTFVTGSGRELPAGKVAFGQSITRDMFRPCISAALAEVADKKNAKSRARAKYAVPRRKEPERFKLSWKRTHYLYDKGKIMRTVDGRIYVPRTYSEPEKYKKLRERLSERRRDRDDGEIGGQMGQDLKRSERLRAEWRKLYNEAVRQERAEARDRENWNKTRGRNDSSGTSSSSPNFVSVSSDDVEKNMNDGTFFYSLSRP